ncbi:MAG: toll/interleukin-1 receptor domain-containing protein [Thermodesulfobacteriota bacterium]|nr:toll/interleukin-1 receptor domain-containing protein [Thermodesulfobacteriota bacterium]
MAQIFVSHAEEDASLAIQLASSLEEEGFSTWYYERDSLPGPSYLLQVGREIEACECVLLFASPSSLESQHVTNEVIRAYEHRKHFLPVLVGITHTEIQEQQPIWRQCLGSATAVPVEDSTFSSVIPKVLQGLEALAVGKAGTAGAATQVSRSKQIHYSQPSTSAPLDTDSPSATRFGDGMVSFRTERFEPSAPVDQERRVPLGLGLSGDHVEEHHPRQIELAFQLLNQSSHQFTISSLRVLYFGKIVIMEDCPARPETTHALYQQKLSIEMTQPRRTELGKLEFAFAGDTRVASAETSSLLDPLEVSLLKPHSLRSFLLSLQCSETVDNRRILLRSQVAQFVGQVRHVVATEHPVMHVAPYSAVAIVEAEIGKVSLSDLDRGNPEPVAAAHVFAVSADLLADTGSALRLFSDNIYSLVPQIVEPELTIEMVPESKAVVTALPLSKWLCQTPAQFIQYFVNWAIKTYDETLAYHIASDRDQIPEGFDPSSVSECCYWHDTRSPLRLHDKQTPVAEPSHAPRALTPDDLVSGQLMPSTPVTRSNFLLFLANLLTRWPEFGTNTLGSLRLLQSADDQILRAKADFVYHRLETMVSHSIHGMKEEQNKAIDSDEE